MVLVILVTLMIVFFSLQSLFTRLYAANYAGPDKGSATAVFSVCYGVLVAAASFFLGGMSFAPSWQTVLLGLINAGMLVLYNTSIIEAGNRGSYSFTMVSCMFGGILVPMAVGVIFLGERLTALQILAVALMLVSLVLMNMQSFSLKGASRSYYLWCIALFLANGLYGTINNLQTQVMNGAQRTEMLTILYLGSALAVIAMEAVRGRSRQLREGFRMGRKSWLYVILACVSATAAANLMLYILTRMDSSILYTIDSGAVLVLSMLYALALFREKPTRAQSVGMAAAVVSIVLISMP
ncbi:MAG: EamA family transporter [Aristaeellaceae bacterium]